MDELDLDEIRNLLLGTWIGIGLIVDTMVRAGILRRSDFVSPLATAETMARDKRRIALTALRHFVATGFSEPESYPAVERRRSGPSKLN